MIIICYSLNLYLLTKVRLNRYHNQPQHFFLPAALPVTGCTFLGSILYLRYIEWEVFVWLTSSRSTWSAQLATESFLLSVRKLTWCLYPSLHLFVWNPCCIFLHTIRPRLLILPALRYHTYFRQVAIPSYLYLYCNFLEIVFKFSHPSVKFFKWFAIRQIKYD